MQFILQDDDDHDKSYEYDGDVTMMMIRKRRSLVFPKQIDDDLYIIGAVCVFVCHKSHYFRTQRIWSFHTFIATFRTQRNWSFPCFLTLLYSKDLVVSHVYRHFPNSKVSGNSKTTKSLEVFKEFGQISCFWTLSVFKSVQKE